MNTTYYTCIAIKLNLKSSNLSVDNFKKKKHSNSLGRNLSPRYGQAILVSRSTFDSCQLIKTWMYNIRLQAPKLARKCEIKHWYACGADGRKVGWSVYGHVIAEFSRMDRFSKLLGFELSPWSNKISAQNFKHYVNSMDRKMSPRYTQVMMVSVYSSLTAVN